MRRAIVKPLLLLGVLCLKFARADAPLASPIAPDSTPALGDSMTLLPRGVGIPSAGLTHLGAFASLAVQHEGRIKPLETMARALLLQWSGRSSGPNSSALSVLADILFAPEKTGDLKIFRIDNPEVADALHIKPDTHRRYAYRELEPALHRLQTLAAKADSVEAEKRNLVEKEFLRTFANVMAYLNLTRTVQFARPTVTLSIQNPETRRALNLPEGDKEPPTFWQLMDRAPLLARILESVGTRPDTSRSSVEREVVGLSRTMYLQSQMAQPSEFRIFPDPASAAPWSSPAEVISDPGRLQKLNAEIGYLAAITGAYRHGDQKEFDKQTGLFQHAIGEMAYSQMETTRFPLEIFYGRVAPLFWANLIYGLALTLCFLFFLLNRPWLYAAAGWVAWAGWGLHVSGIVARILIMHRPPVTSLYETFPFVAAVSIFAALFLERRSRQGVALLCAALLGVVLLSIAHRYAADGDTLQMLVAVLNSNFWLSTHVICVTTGYAACLLCGAIGHIRLVRTVFPGHGGKEALREIDRMVYGTLCFGLLFSFIGTVLGGIWADQSWGRFWGWDPKENGALLIVLWCAILLHAKFFGIIRDLGLAFGSVLGAIIVSLAWLGVNLLNVGLHSYGFTTGAAVKLFSYIGAELVFLLIMGIAIARQRKTPGSAVTTASP